MNNANRHVLLLSTNPADHIVVPQLFENHPDRIFVTCAYTAPKNYDEYALIVSRHPISGISIPVYIMPDTPGRMGVVLDDIERHILQMHDKIDVTYRHYTILGQQNILIINKQKIPLTETETNIIRALIMAADTGLTRDEMLKNIWDYRPDLDTHTLETHIYRLRQKIETDQAQPQYLCTMPNGYKLM